MPTLVTRFNWGKGEDEEENRKNRQLNDTFTDITIIVNNKVSKRVISGQNPPASDQVNKNFEIGDVWIRTDTNSAWMMTSRTTDIAVTWKIIT